MLEKYFSEISETLRCTTSAHVYDSAIISRIGMACGPGDEVFRHQRRTRIISPIQGYLMLREGIRLIKSSMDRITRGLFARVMQSHGSPEDY